MLTSPTLVQWNWPLPKVTMDNINEGIVEVRQGLGSISGDEAVCVRVCVRVRVRVHAHVHVRVHVRVYVCMYTVSGI